MERNGIKGLLFIYCVFYDRIDHFEGLCLFCIWEFVFVLKFQRRKRINRSMIVCLGLLQLGIFTF